MSLPSRIEEKIDRSAGPDACHPWTAARFEKGYGAVKFEGKVRRVHTVVWEVAHGPLDGVQVLHRCDNPPCCNLRHLFSGTNLDNSDDKVAKGRHVRRFSSEEIEEIRGAPDEWGVTTRLAREYGVSHQAISKIRRGRTYKGPSSKW